MIVCSIFVFIAENGGPASLIANPFDAVWWGVTTMTTVGYGDTYPVTPEGRLGAMVLMILGIGLFSGITATITSILTTSRDQGLIRATWWRPSAGWRICVIAAR